MPTLPDRPPGAANAGDAELAQRIAARDRDAFALLMRRHNQLLFRTARSILRDDSEAEDVLQEAYLSAYRAIGQFRADARLSTWLTRIVVNHALARLRQTSRRSNVMQLHAEARNQESEGDMVSSASESPENGAMRSQMRQLMEQSIDALPEVFRTVFVLRAVEEMSGEDVAACLAIPEATVRSRYFRARAMLRAALARHIDFALEDAYCFDGARCDRIVAGVLARLPGA
ncbi:MAG: RNA polymerase sigma factor [Pseudomonadota bacterium]